MSVRSILLAASSPVANPGDKWVSRDSLSATGESFAPEYVRGIIYGNSKYVVFGDGGLVATSTDLSTWTYATPIPSCASIVSMTYGNGLFVAVGNSYTYSEGVYTSPDGITWTKRSKPSAWNDLMPYRVVWNGSIFVMIGQAYALCATSADGITWTNQTGLSSVLGSVQLMGLLWTGTVFFVVTYFGSYVATSTNGVTWSLSTALRTHVSSLDTQYITNYGQVIVGFRLNGGFTYASSNSGASWMTVNDIRLSPTLLNVISAATDGATVVGADGFNGYTYDSVLFDIYTSTTAYVVPTSTFQAYPYTPDQSFLAGCAYIDGGSYPGYYLFGAKGRLWYLGTIASPTNATTALTKQDTYFTTGWDAYAIAYDGTNVVVAGEYGRIAKGTGVDASSNINYSIKSNTLNQVANWGSVGNINALIWSLSKYIAVGDYGKVATSSDGTTWTYQGGLRSTTWGTTNNAYCIASNGTTLLVAGMNGAVATSTDGVTWTYQSGLSSTTWGTNTARGVTWDGSKFLVVGDAGKVAYSTDGATWTYVGNLAATTWGTNTCWAVTWSSALSLYVVVGANGKLATSTNGTAWTVQTNGLLVTNNMFAVTYASGKFVTVGRGHNSNQALILTSNDGVTWVNKSVYIQNSDWKSGDEGRGVVWAGDRFIICGTNGRMATSP
jgi:hypothetical protein